MPYNRGPVRRKEWGVAIPIALVYPNSFKVGMGNLGFQFIYQYLHSHPSYIPERFFLLDSPTKEPLSIESSRSLRDFAVIAFALPFENDYAAVPAFLRAAGAPVLSVHRGPSDPLIVAGGVSISINPEPLAAFMDLIHIGEIGPEIVSLFDQLPDVLASKTRAALFEKLRHIPGLYIPSVYKFVFDREGIIQDIKFESGFPEKVKAIKRRSNDVVIPASVFFTPEAEFGDSLLLEINRGCGRGCNFCAGGWIHSPCRYSSLDALKDHLDRATDKGRVAGLIGSDLAGHPALEEILTYIINEGGRFSLSSIRPEGLSPKIIELVAATGQKTATLAPETASNRMKKVIGKKIPSERFYELVERLVTAGIPNVRFYFMLGLPTETDEDAEAIAEFVLIAQKVFVNASRTKGAIGHVSVQINPFVPKPWTPFQWAPMATKKQVEYRIKIIRKILKGTSNIVIRAESYKSAYIQGFISRADRRIANTLVRASFPGSWPAALKSCAYDADFFALREKAADEILPWDITDHGISKKTIRTIYEKAVTQGG